MLEPRSAIWPAQFVIERSHGFMAMVIVEQVTKYPDAPDISYLASLFGGCGDSIGRVSPSEGD
jgi:hypothetical protein